MSRWLLRPADSPAERMLAENLGLSPIAARILAARGVRSAGEARSFLAPSLAACPDPFAMRGMEGAVEVLVAAARAGDRIVVFGDYDVDGVTAVAQLRAVLRTLGADAVPFLPHRVRDGYGLKPETLRSVVSRHRPRVIVTVDCGITAAAAVREAAEAGIDVVITDHHLPPEELPEGAAVVNPRQPGCPYPFKELCGSGIAFKMAQAIIRREGLSLSESSLVKVAALGTIADIVPLQGENRAIVAEGLRGLSKPRAPGLKALLAEAGISGRAPTSEEIAFRVGPRLNAAGRLDSAELALSLLEERDAARASGMARELSARNSERQAHERRVVSEAAAQLAEEGDPAEEGILVAAAAGWPRGVLGIAAARLARRFHRPALLFSLEGEKAVGSGRSVPAVPLHGLLSELSSFFLEFGGHSQACGATIAVADYGAFREKARALFAERVAPEQREPVWEADAEIGLGEATPDLAAEMTRFEPFGQGNPRPLFLVRGLGCLGAPRPAGARGWVLTLSRGDRRRRAIWWTEDSPAAVSGTIDVLAHLRPSARAEEGVELEIAAVRPAQP